MKNVFNIAAFIAALVLNIIPSQAATQNPVTGGCPLSQWVNAVNVNTPGQACAQVTVSDLSAAGSTSGQVLVSTGPTTGPVFTNSANVLLPGVTIPTVAGSVNGIVITQTVTGGTPTISAGGPGSDANAPLGLSGAGNGDIVLFANNPTSTGNLLFANQASFIPVSGFATCPGDVPGKTPMGMSPVVTGYFVFDDWLGIPHRVSGC